MPRKRLPTHNHKLRDYSYLGCFISITAEAVYLAHFFVKHTFERPEGVSSATSAVCYYDNPEEKIASVVRSIIKNHYFSDGNKRTALLVCIALCELNGIRLKCKKLGKAIEDIARNNYLPEIIADILFCRQ